MELIRNFEVRLGDRLRESLNFIQVILGPRQVGKSTGLRRIVKEWPGPSLMVSADAVSPPTSDWIATHWRRARAMGRGTLLVIDEIQKITGWSETVKVLFDEDRPKRELKVVLVGSASLSLQPGLSESLAGRYEVIRAHHWSLYECREAFKFTLEQFLAFGGYPAACELIHRPQRWNDFVANAIIEPVVSKDIQGLADIRKPALFRQTFELIMRYPAQEVSLQKLLGQLQDTGNVTTIQHYIDLFQGAFLVSALQKYSTRPLTTRASSPKFLPLNTALVGAYCGPERAARDPEWKGRLFETAIGARLSQAGGQLYYWRDGKWEVDFVWVRDRRVYAIEVKSGRKKSSRGTDEFLAQHKKAIPIVLDLDSGTRLLGAKDVEASIPELR